MGNSMQCCRDETKPGYILASKNGKNRRHKISADPAEHFESIMKSEIEALKHALDHVNNGQGPKTHLQLVKLKNDHANFNTRPILEKLFDDHDTDKSGDLNPEETKKLVAAYVKWNKSGGLESRVVSIMRTPLEDAVKKGGADRDHMDQQLQWLDDMFEELRPTAKRIAQRLCDSLEKDMSTICKEIQKNCDKDHNGRIEKDEFVDHMRYEMNRVFSPIHLTLQSELEPHIHKWLAGDSKGS
jgi:hypothetical protein